MIKAKWRLSKTHRFNGISFDIKGNFCWSSNEMVSHIYTLTLYCSETGRSKIYNDIRIPFFDEEDMHRLVQEFIGELV